MPSGSTGQTLHPDTQVFIFGCCLSPQVIPDYLSPSRMLTKLQMARHVLCRVASFLFKSVLGFYKIRSKLLVNCCSHHLLPPCLLAHHSTYSKTRFLCSTILIFDPVLGICLVTVHPQLQTSLSPGSASTLHRALF